MPRMLRSLLVALLLAGALPASALADNELPAPDAVVCPAPIYLEGVPRIPDEAPADCVYLEALPMPLPGDPCGPDESGALPDACLSEPPVDRGEESCWISSDGATNCPRTGVPDERPLAEYLILSVSPAGSIEASPTEGTLAFYDGRLSASVGCNTIGGSARVGDNGAIEVGELFMTMIYCEELADEESALLAILRGTDLRIEGDELSSEAGTALLSLRSETSLVGAGGSAPLWLLLLLPLAVGLVGISLGLVRRSDR
jgi:heat shock protein HslJ